MKTSEKIYANAFISVPLIGPQRLKRIQKHFASLADAWNCQKTRQFEEIGITGKVLAGIQKAQRSCDPGNLFTSLENQNIACVAHDEPVYPKILKQIHSPPPLLYMRGAIKPEDSLSLAVVGTRKCTEYGQRLATQLAGELAQQGMTIVSGLALGIDTLAHKAALDADGRTIAVLGGSVAKSEVFPRTNARLGEQITKHGALISEYPPGVPARKQNFPVRNRIISGLSLGTLVIEAGKRSGALITAFLALEQNREVMAVPGNISAPQSAGCNMLIRKGAALITGVENIFEALSLEKPKEVNEARKILPESATEKAICTILESGARSIDQLVF